MIVEDESMKYYIPFTKEEVLDVSLQNGILVPDSLDESHTSDSDETTEIHTTKDPSDE